MMPDAWCRSHLEYVWNANYRAGIQHRRRAVHGRQAGTRRAGAVETRGPHRDGLARSLRQILANSASCGRAHPGGAGRRAPRHLFNCFVMGRCTIRFDGIFSSLGESMVTIQAAADRHRFSTLRPSGMPAAHSGNTASGPSRSCRCGSGRRGPAVDQRAARRDDGHLALRPSDIERFIDARRDARCRTSGWRAVSDALHAGRRRRRRLALLFPLAGPSGAGGRGGGQRLWSGRRLARALPGRAHPSSASLWERLLRVAFESGEPGVIFIDHVQRSDNLATPSN